ncbi:MAG: membrane protein insertion efficiency factor YidD [Desulfobacterales bacterium]|nr:membrane protein insertion efficiency factor YidD [Desulfobacterales bacterium]MDP7417592.1 membrane protein insertion efficiency factor YidD [Desulfobacterales bacterium]HJO61774.1 membrane protein insertion efficiency factor YidD [Desulfobacterales bacterium]|tara:strand:- start:749 stop:1144 length:396 start_codon:yes stop_codon:yes gene_type:complete
MINVKMKDITCRLILSSFFVGILSSCVLLGAEREAPGNDDNPLAATIQVYRRPLNHLSAVRRGGCPMYPSCSNYSKQAIQKHGMIIGWMMTTDRLLRCGRDEMKLSPQIFISGRLNYYDPVEINDYWWNEE